jgi:DNA repair protein RadA/Sms
VGLLGELRSVVGLERRLREAARLGFARALVPRPAAGMLPGRIDGLEIATSETLADAITLALADRAVTHGEAVPAMLG